MEQRGGKEEVGLIPALRGVLKACFGGGRDEVGIGHSPALRLLHICGKGTQVRVDSVQIFERKLSCSERFARWVSMRP